MFLSLPTKYKKASLILKPHPDPDPDPHPPTPHPPSFADNMDSDDDDDTDSSNTKTIFTDGMQQPRSPHHGAHKMNGLPREERSSQELS